MEATIANGSHEGEKVFIPRMALRPSSTQFSFEWERLQFPVRPAFSVTINKAQGQSLKKVTIYLKDEVFSHGQLLNLNPYLLYYDFTIIIIILSYIIL